MTIALRQYQSAAAESALAAFGKHRGVVIQLPTGAGKTVVASHIASRWSSENKAVWFIGHRREIIDQARARVGDFASLATVGKASELAAAGAPYAIIIDEAHHIPAPSWSALAQSYPDALLLGLSATPGRLDGKALDAWFGAIVSGPSTRELIEAGHLARYRYFAPVLPDLEKVKVREGDYDRKSVETMMMGRAIVGDVVKHYREHADGQTAILFAVSVKASRDMAERFNAAGIAAAHIDGETPDDERDAAIEALRAGSIKVLCNVEVFTEGFDSPNVGAVILLRPTRSLTLCRQMIGRGMRPSADGEPVVILDHAGLIGEHGAPDVEYVWSLDGKPARRKIEIEGGERVRMRRCPECSACHEWAAACEDCGHEYAAGPRELTEISGRLEEVSGPLGCVTRRAFAEMLGRRPHSLVFSIQNGMPVRPDGLIDVAAANRWLADRKVWRDKKQSERTKLLHLDPTFVEKRIAAVRRATASPGFREAVRRAQEHVTDEVKSARVERMKKMRADPAAAAKNLAAVKANEANPEVRARKSALRRALNATPEGRANTHALHANPEIANRRIEAIRESHARRKQKRSDQSID